MCELALRPETTKARDHATQGKAFLNNHVGRKTAIHVFWACLAHLLFNLEGLDAASAGEDDLVGVP